MQRWKQPRPSNNSPRFTKPKHMAIQKHNPSTHEGWTKRLRPRSLCHDGSLTSQMPRLPELCIVRQRAYIQLRTRSTSRSIHSGLTTKTRVGLDSDSPAALDAASVKASHSPGSEDSECIEHIDPLHIFPRHSCQCTTSETSSWNPSHAEKDQSSDDDGHSNTKEPVQSSQSIFYTKSDGHEIDSESPKASLVRHRKTVRELLQRPSDVVNDLENTTAWSPVFEIITDLDKAEESSGDVQWPLDDAWRY